VMDQRAAQAAVFDLLSAFGAIHDEHTVDTPARVARAWGEALSGYEEDPTVHLERTFPAPTTPGAVMVTGIEVASTCAHHMLPIRGTATVAYLPHGGDRIVGLSKLARLVDGYARRLQVQERIGAQVVDALDKVLSPRAAGCVITAEHGCMSHRGVRQLGARTTTASWIGEWSDGQNGAFEVLAEHRAATR
jgi:GTP cyclohydrolase I